MISSFVNLIVLGDIITAILFLIKASQYRALKNRLKWFLSTALPSCLPTIKPKPPDSGFTTFKYLYVILGVLRI